MNKEFIINLLNTTLFYYDTDLSVYIAKCIYEGCRCIENSDRLIDNNIRLDIAFERDYVYYVKIKIITTRAILFLDVQIDNAEDFEIDIFNEKNIFYEIKYHSL